MTASPVRRLPDFVIIGAQKAGTTTLFRWLADEPEIYMPSQKEIHFFSRDDLWKCGFDWYRQCFAGAAPGQLVGEASTSYTMSDYGSVPAERMASAMPHARLICILRNPEERLRSHYRHQVVRRRENRSLAEAAGHSMSGYLTTSLYFERLSPWLERFPRQQICVVRFEDLIGAGSAAWEDILRHLGLALRPKPVGTYNSSRDRAPYLRPVQGLATSRLVSIRNVVSRRAQPLVKRLLAGRTRPVKEGLAQSEQPLPAQALVRMAEDAEKLAALLGWPTPIWPEMTPP